MNRDCKKKEALEADGWKVLVLWECEVSENPHACAKRVNSILAHGSQSDQ